MKSLNSAAAIAILTISAASIGSCERTPEPVENYKPVNENIRTFSGEIVKVMYNGPPDFGEKPDPDSIIHAALIKLDQPQNIHIAGEYGGDYPNVEFIQIAYKDGEDYRLLCGNHGFITGIVDNPAGGNYISQIVISITGGRIAKTRPCATIDKTAK